MMYRALVESSRKPLIGRDLHFQKAAAKLLVETCVGLITTKEKNQLERDKKGGAEEINDIKRG